MSSIATLILFGYILTLGKTTRIQKPSQDVWCTTATLDKEKSHTHKCNRTQIDKQNSALPVCVFIDIYAYSAPTNNPDRKLNIVAQDAFFMCRTGAAEVQFSRPPRLTPSEEEHVFRTGGSFELICEAAKPINWKLPKLSVSFLPLTKLCRNFSRRKLFNDSISWLEKFSKSLR